MLFPLYLSSTRLFSFPPTIYLSSCTVPLFSFLTSSSFPLLHPLHPTLFLISLDPAPPSLSFSIFSSSYSYSTLPLTSLMSTVYFHHLASSLSLLPPPACPAPCLLSSTFNFTRGKRRERRKRGKKRRPFVYVLQVSRIYVFCIWYFSPCAPNASERTMPFWYFRFSLASLPLRLTPDLDSWSFSFFRPPLSAYRKPCTLAIHACNDKI